jgi:hypothetical protein
MGRSSSEESGWFFPIPEELTVLLTFPPDMPGRCPFGINAIM